MEITDEQIDAIAARQFGFANLPGSLHQQWCEDVGRPFARAILALEKDAALPVVPEDVREAVERMCLPLHESRLAGATAQADARCMAKIKAFIDSLAAAPSQPGNAQQEVL